MKTLRKKLFEILEEAEFSSMGGRTVDAILEAVREMVPEEALEDLPKYAENTHHWGRGFNACRSEFLRRLEEGK